jgi:deoxyribonuclease-4
LGPNIIPAVDFGHLHAASGGGLATKEAFAGIFDRIESALGRNGFKRLHIHFSPVEYSGAGERRHLTTRDVGFGPDFTHLAEMLVEVSAEFTVICESDGLQAEDALVYKSIYEKVAAGGRAD